MRFYGYWTNTVNVLVSKVTALSAFILNGVSMVAAHVHWVPLTMSNLIHKNVIVVSSTCCIQTLLVTAEEARSNRTHCKWDPVYLLLVKVQSKWISVILIMNISMETSETLVRSHKEVHPSFIKGPFTERTRSVWTFCDYWTKVILMKW